MKILEEHDSISKSNQAFTLTEVMVALVIIGVMSGLALPQYQKTIRQSHERDAIAQLLAIRTANVIYYSNNSKQYLNGNFSELTSINSNLKTNILSNGLTYSYNSGAPNSIFNAKASWDESGTANDFTICIDESLISNINPCCSSGTCLTLQSCALVSTCST